MSDERSLSTAEHALNSHWTESPAQESTPTEIDLTNFAHWLELNPPVSTLAGMIDLIGSDLYRRHWPTYGAHAKQLAKDIRTTLKYHEDHAEKPSRGTP